MPLFGVAACLIVITSNASEALPPARMKEWSARFEKEIWPLLARNGKDGCVGCHTPRHRSTLRIAGGAEEEFGKLLVGGYLLPDDPGALLHVVSTPNPKTHMPPGRRPSWKVDEIAALKRFVIELDSALNKS